MESARESIDLWYKMTQNLISSLQSLSEVVDQEHKSCCQMPHILDFLFNEWKYGQRHLKEDSKIIIVSDQNGFVQKVKKKYTWIKVFMYI